VLAASIVGNRLKTSENVAVTLPSRRGRGPTPVRRTSHFNAPSLESTQISRTEPLFFVFTAIDCAAVSLLDAVALQCRPPTVLPEVRTGSWASCNYPPPARHLLANLLLSARQKKIRRCTFNKTWRNGHRIVAQTHYASRYAGLPLLNSFCRFSIAQRKLTMNRTYRSSLGHPHSLLSSSFFSSTSLPPTYRIPPSISSEPLTTPALRGSSPHCAATHPPPWRGNPRKSPCGNWCNA
jgi:hypothetical protein